MAVGVLLHDLNHLVQHDVGLGEGDEAQVVVFVFCRCERAAAGKRFAVERSFREQALLPSVHRRRMHTRTLRPLLEGAFTVEDDSPEVGRVGLPAHVPGWRGKGS